jgi:hypothetical protein
LSDAEKQKEALNQFCNAVDAAVSALHASLGIQNQKPIKGSVELPFDPNKIQWTQQKGTKGPYERSDDVNNPDHKALLKFLTEHAGGCISSEGFFYWTFTDAKSIGRKLKPQKETT